MFRFLGSLALVGGIIIIWHCLSYPGDAGFEKIELIVGAVVSGAGIALLLGRFPTKVSTAGVVFDDVNSPDQPPRAAIPQQTLTEEQREERKRYSGNLHLPGAEARKFHLLEDSLALQPTPCADPMTPMYMLDSEYRIIDWNDAFSLAFDGTMEGRRGESVLEWVYFLDNYKEILDHGVEVFSDPSNLPPIDVEQIEYKSLVYGRLTGKKRAYHIPDDDGTSMGWLATIEPQFEDKEKKSRFYTDLLTRLRHGLMWSEYALSYDSVLTNTQVYPELMSALIGESNSNLDIPPYNARILDLGAGTGNFTKHLADTGTERLVVALDNNAMMLNILRSKCQKYLRKDPGGPGVIATRQDITSLFGLKEGYFDYAFLNNVLYTLEDSAVPKCLREVHRILKPGGQVRISEPRTDANLDVLFTRIERDLKRNGKFEGLRDQFLHIRDINYKNLQSMIHRWNAEDIKTLLTDSGFEDFLYTTDEAYAGQSRIVCARK